MKGYRGMILILAVLLPSVASAQKKPGNNRDTRSAEVYLDGAKKEQVLADKQKFFQQALDATLRGAKNDPDNARVYLLMGQAQVGLNNLTAADSAFDRAEQLYPPYKTEVEPYRLNAWVILYNQGIAALQAGDNAKAVQSMEQADAMYQGRPEAVITMAQLHQQGGDLQKAEEDYRRALTILRGPSRQGLASDVEKKWAANEEESVLRLAGLLAETNRSAEAISLYQEFLRRQPDNVMAKSNLGVTMMRAGKTAEAAPLFNELLERPDLEENALFNIGIGLFRANQYAQAVRAFDRVLVLNPYSHDGLYNLAQSILGETADGEKAKAGKTGAELATANEHLLKDYARMGEVAQKLLEIDPANTQAIMMLAQSQRSRGELEVDKVKGEEWKKAVLTTLQEHDNWPFEVENLQVRWGAEKSIVTGSMKNLKAAQDTPLKISFMMLDKAGATVGQPQEVSVNAPATGESRRFTVEVPSPQSAVAWKYTIVK
ncbi:MAG: tetratricopeptide repeat protein [Gemmatimonadetes bacterium]|nr:tetratricopeptide repeat protein [Gemmatimonadota bacterium]